MLKRILVLLTAILLLCGLLNGCKKTESDALEQYTEKLLTNAEFWEDSFDITGEVTFSEPILICDYQYDGLKSVFSMAFSYRGIGYETKENACYLLAYSDKVPFRLFYLEKDEGGWLLTDVYTEQDILYQRILQFSEYLNRRHPFRNEITVFQARNNFNLLSSEVMFGQMMNTRSETIYFSFDYWLSSIKWFQTYDASLRKMNGLPILGAALDVSEEGLLIRVIPYTVIFSLLLLGILVAVIFCCRRKKQKT